MFLLLRLRWLAMRCMSMVGDMTGASGRAPSDAWRRSARAGREPTGAMTRFEGTRVTRAMAIDATGARGCASVGLPRLTMGPGLVDDMGMEERKEPFRLTCLNNLRWEEREEAGQVRGMGQTREGHSTPPRTQPRSLALARELPPSVGGRRRDGFPLPAGVHVLQLSDQRAGGTLDVASHGRALGTAVAGLSLARLPRTVRDARLAARDPPRPGCRRVARRAAGHPGRRGPRPRRQRRPVVSVRGRREPPRLLERNVRGRRVQRALAVQPVEVTRVLLLGALLKDRMDEGLEL